MKLSVIIPALDEAGEIAACVASLGAEGPEREVLLADGGSRDGTVEAVDPSVRVVASPPGRARQMNAAAAEATGSVLVFLHADCRLPPGALRAAALALADPAVVGGGFHKRWRSRHPLLRGGTRLRTAAWFRLGAVLGDQALFVRRDVFERLGGFREDATAEDLDFALRLRREGLVVLLPPEVEVSARRLESAGVLRTWARWWVIGLTQARRTLRDLRR